MKKDMECIACNGSGVIEAYAGVDLHTWDCPECNGSGKVSRKTAESQNECREAMSREIVKYGGSVK